jgi:protein SCO1/2
VLRRVIIGAAALAAAYLIALAVNPATSARAQSARWGADYFPNVPLTTHEGKQVRLYDDLIKGKIVAVNLIYTSCKYACPLETARLAQVQKLLGDRMGRDVFFYSISIDPEVDTPEVLKAYAAKFHAGPGWLFLTGKKADIDLISRKLGLASQQKDPSVDGHTPHLMIGNEATGQWVRNSALDNAQFLATTIGTWLNSWQTAGKPTRSYAEAPVLKIDSGEYAFKTHCAPCHTIGKGDNIGPDLAGVTTRRDRAWLTRLLVDPDKMLATDPIAKAMLAKYKQVRMPALGLATSDATMVLDYIASAGSKPGVARTLSPVPPPSDVAMSAVTDPYLDIQRALAADQVTGIAASARELAAAAAKMGTDTTPIQRAALILASQAATPADARAGFEQVGTAIMAFASRRRAPLGADVRVAYCPMLDKYWLQRGPAIHNPFYGQSMRDCGRIVSQLPGA